ncbi:Mannose-6-phosphate isomerase [Coemansia sp. RSA 1200]|nr:Mannose-6-phosphate isomerase [Coemansia sp. RSA 1200]
MAIVRLSCVVNNYHWGKHGLSSKAAQFAATNPDVTIDSTQAYSELWMGTHPSGPSKVYSTDTKLSTLIEKDPTGALGPSVERKFGPQLPFLFKVLSIETALSIQAHPDKALAGRLHKERPDVYRDDNHKPEMSIALTQFAAMSGFRPLEQIAGFLDAYREFRALVPQTADGFSQIVSASSSADEGEKKAALRRLFAELMGASSDDVATQLDHLVKRILQTKGDPSLPASATKATAVVDELVLRLSTEYPGDVGVFCVFMLNVLQLSPGEAFFMGPNDPHAYLSGDCIECMATSDNVVRAGLTPKMRDVDVLVDMLTYDFGTPQAKLLEPTAFARGTGGRTVVYDPPIDEFAVACTRLLPDEEETVESMQGPQIVIVVQGSGRLTSSGGSGGADDSSFDVHPGYVYFVYPGTSYTLRAVADSKDGGGQSQQQQQQQQQLVTYTAFCLA